MKAKIHRKFNKFLAKTILLTLLIAGLHGSSFATAKFSAGEEQYSSFEPVAINYSIETPFALEKVSLGTKSFEGCSTEVVSVGSTEIILPELQPTKTLSEKNNYVQEAYSLNPVLSNQCGDIVVRSLGSYQTKLAVDIVRSQEVIAIKKFQSIIVFHFEPGVDKAETAAIIHTTTLGSDKLDAESKYFYTKIIQPLSNELVESDFNKFQILRC